MPDRRPAASKRGSMNPFGGPPVSGEGSGGPESPDRPERGSDFQIHGEFPDRSSPPECKPSTAWPGGVPQQLSKLRADEEAGATR